MSRWPLSISSDGDSATWSVSAVFQYTQDDKIFHYIQRGSPVFQFVPIVSGPVTEHHQKELGSVLFTSLQIFIGTDVVSPRFFFSGWSANSLSFPKLSLEVCATSLIISMALWWTMPVAPHLSCDLVPRTGHSIWGVVWVEGKAHFPWPLGSTLPYAAQDLIYLLLGEGTLLIHV